ncbi:zinc finger protein 816-like [Nylanderia fulva]|uniref:zinc finger protein 816-like n=1 Tax=Nylanderia fulva TaxID=613905 RepID=UPI0010FB5E9D|nr:zinc finger protein 816-like [Nylanderia fulva]XP_029176878.1 zinc finger protein 816-like [Nylanderia fulva]XP_029176879.1 zinc finger protein 816-like [Nylanderia fulva]
MLYPKEFRTCAIMSEECPNCGQLTNASASRLVKDSCGHSKCRMCLLYEEHGCKICQAKHHVQEELCSVNRDSNDTHKSSSEEIVLPLELVINKDSKSKKSQDSTSVECTSSNLHYDNVTLEKEGVYKFAPNDTIANNDSNKLYIYGNDHNSANLQTPRCKQAEEKLDEEKNVEKNKNVKRDRSHITIVPGNPEKYKCNVCSKVFHNKKSKCYHDACVTGVKPYQCIFCDKSFVKRSHFEYHERVHKGYKPHKCNQCGKAFPQRNKLNRHMLSHKEKQFKCSECNKRYSKRDDLRNHLNVHNATSTYNCKSCDKSFRVLTNLKRHMRTHISERPYTCDECNKSFKDRFLLKRHKRTHEKDRPFSCAHCNKVFLSKSELRRHLTVHSDEKPFSCEYCQTPFRRKDNLNRHIRHHHTEDFSSEIRETPRVEADSARSSSTKSSQQRPRPKQSRKAQPKSPGKVTASLPSSHVDQINSRLDSMGNITPVIRTTSEMSNAVPVINGPINIRRFEDRTDKKTFTYTEPIPIAEAAVINCRIEEKLYPQSASSHNYFVRSCLKDRYSRVNSYPNNKLTLQENHSSSAASTSSRIEPTLYPRGIEERKDFAANFQKEKIVSYDEKEKGNRVEDKTVRRRDEKSREGGDVVSLRESNCVSTIKKHTTQQVAEGHLNENSTANGDDSEVTILPKNSQDSCRKKQSDIHWRRRIAETLKLVDRRLARKLSKICEILIAIVITSVLLFSKIVLSKFNKK